MAAELARSCGGMVPTVNEALLLEAANDFEKDHLNGSAFLAMVKECFDDGSGYFILDLLSKDKYQEIVEISGWEIVSIIVPYLNKIKDGNVYQRILQVICKICSPKEIILALTGHLDEIESIFCLKTCLEFLQKAIMNVKNKRKKLVEGIFKDVSMQFKRLCKITFAECSVENDEDDLDSFANAKQQSKGVGTLDSITLPKQGVTMGENGCRLDFTGKRLCCMTDNVLTFMKPFSHKTNTEFLMVSPSDRDLTSICPNIIFTLLIYPLGCHPISISEKDNLNQCPSCLKCHTSLASAVIENLFLLRIPFIQLMESRSHSRSSGDIESDEEDSFVSAGKAMLIHFILVKNIGLTYFPFVLSPRLIFMLTFQPILDLLKRNDVAEARRSSLELIENIMSRLEENSLAFDTVSLSEGFHLFEMLMEIAANESNKDTRASFLQLFSFSLKRFEFTPRLKILRQLLLKINHPGASSFLVYCIKNEAIHVAPKTLAAPQNHLKDYFYEAICISLNPVKNEHFDVLMNSDRVIAALNMVIFLVLRGSMDSDQFGILSRFVQTENIYLIPLQRKVETAYSHHQSLLTEASTKKHNSEEGTTKNGDNSSGEDDGYRIKEVNIKGIQLALNTLDIIRSLFGRISELYRNSRNNELQH